jgi:MgtE intracellular N domain
MHPHFTGGEVLTPSYAPHVVAFCTLPRSAAASASPRISRLAAAALTFLRFEATAPEQWRVMRWPCSPWTLKGGALRTFGRIDPAVVPAAPLRALIVGAVARQQRCQDHLYWQLARTLDDADLRAGLSLAAVDGTESTRLRAGFLQWLLDHPDQHTDGRGWRRWLRAYGQPLPAPVAQRLAELGRGALRRPTHAADLLRGWPTVELTLVLDSLERGPATQIAAALPPATAAAALAGMDARRASQTLRGMAEPAAAAILELMPPAAAARRLPGTSRPHILAYMRRDAAIRCLHHLSPADAAHRLRYLPADLASASRWFR